MDSVIIEGRTVEEAVDRALQRLGSRIDQVKIEVIEEKKGRLFGLLGGGSCRVKVSNQLRTEERIEEVLGGTLRLMGIPSQIEVAREKEDFSVEIGTVESDGLLIGKHGETLHALEHLLNRIVHKDSAEQGRVKLDVGGYRKRRNDQLRDKALGMARKVKETGREVATDPLFSPDRRVVHLALTGDSGVRTYTVGDGLYKSVVVAPAGKGDGRGSGGGRPRGSRSQNRDRDGEGGGNRGGGRSRSRRRTARR
ncbi:MAG: Jag N-terminal domain-containing protein [Candidatus Eisenbacteria bacterium]|nr:Jag N-terminal domain-containing protein [Candidatus Eisenbacteria bacterium]